MDGTACTGPQCLYNGALYLYLYLYSPYGPYGFVQSLSACTTVHFNFTYTCTLPKGRTACTEPLCLYNGTLYFYLLLYSHYGPTASTEPQCLYHCALYFYLYLK